MKKAEVCDGDSRPGRMGEMREARLPLRILCSKLEAPNIAVGSLDYGFLTWRSAHFRIRFRRRSSSTSSIPNFNPRFDIFPGAEKRSEGRPVHVKQRQRPATGLISLSRIRADASRLPVRKEVSGIADRDYFRVSDTPRMTSPVRSPRRPHLRSASLAVTTCPISFFAGFLNVDVSASSQGHCSPRQRRPHQTV